MTSVVSRAFESGLHDTFPTEMSIFKCTACSEYIAIVDIWFCDINRIDRYYHIVGKANEGKAVVLPTDMSAQAMDMVIRRWFPAIGNTPYRLCRARGNFNVLEPLDEEWRTPHLIKERAEMKHSALYIQPLLVNAIKII